MPWKTEYNNVTCCTCGGCGTVLVLNHDTGGYDHVETCPDCHGQTYIVQPREIWVDEAES